MTSEDILTATEFIELTEGLRLSSSSTLDRRVCPPSPPQAHLRASSLTRRPFGPARKCRAEAFREAEAICREEPGVGEGLR